MARQTSRFRQDVYVRFLVTVERGIIIVAKSSGRHLFCENQVNELALGLGEKYNPLPQAKP